MNQNRIYKLENTLLDVENSEIKKRVANMELFEGLHSEKPTPIILRLGKKSHPIDFQKLRTLTESGSLNPRTE